MSFQRKINAKILNVSYEYSRDVTDMNATLSEDGALFIYLKSLVDVNQAFLTVVLSFSTDRSDKFDMNYLNKTVNFCKLLSGARYEPLIKLIYQLSSKKWHLPQRCPIKKVFANFANLFRFSQTYNFRTICFMLQTTRLSPTNFRQFYPKLKCHTT